MRPVKIRRPSGVKIDRSRSSISRIRNPRYEIATSSNRRRSRPAASWCSQREDLADDQPQRNAAATSASVRWKGGISLRGSERHGLAVLGQHLLDLGGQIRPRPVLAVLESDQVAPRNADERRELLEATDPS
jgi:hypothetical protein